MTYNNDSCVIVAQAKTGSTGLFHALLRTKKFGSNAYEPKKKMPDPDSKQNNLTKILLKDYDLGKASKLLGTIDRHRFKVLLVRDPRDRFVSGLCYMGYRNLKDHAAKAAFYDILETKSKDPKSVSCLELSEELRYLSNTNFNLIENTLSGMQFLMKANDSLTDPYVYKYESFVEGRFHNLEEYLGIDNITKAEDRELKTRGKAIRTKGCGDWKDWFLPEDILFFRKNKIVLDYFQKFGYTVREDWELNENQTILPEHSYKYFAKVVKL